MTVTTTVDGRKPPDVQGAVDSRSSAGLFPFRRYCATTLDDRLEIGPSPATLKATTTKR
jgi:hypothetical protein